MGITTMVNGKIIKQMDLEFFVKNKDQNIKEIGLKIN